MPARFQSLTCWLLAMSWLGFAGSAGAAETSQASPSAKAVKAKTRPAAKTAASRSRKPAAPVDKADTRSYGDREEAIQFGDEVAARQNIDVQWIRRQLEQARFVPAVARLMTPPPAGTAKNWAAYHDRFIEPVRLRAGRAYWDENEQWLVEAQARYGVPPEIIVGIIGVETVYGQQMGSFRVIDALATLAFDYPVGRRDRRPFFRDELENYLRMCHEQSIDPQQLRGSYAGAMGMPQFMPSSIRKYAVDFDGDGRIDLHRNSADVIGSVANYLAEFGWKADQPTHFEVAVPVDASDRAALLAPDILPTFAAREFSERGARLPPSALAHEGKLALVELQNGNAAPSYVAGTSNFYTITRYNWSSYYAMAVIELGRAVKSAR